MMMTQIKARVMNKCARCGSHAINPGQNGRKIGVNEHLCDVCYWKEEVERVRILKYREGYDAGYIKAMHAISEQNKWGVSK